MIEHGGRLRQAAAHYGIPLADWLDLSTGINPNGWPVPSVSAAAWARLPEDGDGLVDAACAVYGAPDCLPVAGSQMAIQALPHLRSPGRVGVLSPGYAEHAHAWRQAGHEVVAVTGSAVSKPLSPSPSPARGEGSPLDVLVLMNPNNPTGERFTPEQLMGWHAELAARGGWLVVDEAFMDATPAHSIAAHTARPGLIVLRSLGKFYGLAGARAGFVLAEAALLKRLAERLGPWTVSGPARFVAQQALKGTAWQAVTRGALIAAGDRLAAVLRQHGLTPSGGTALFQWLQTPRAAEIHAALARHGILTRLFEHPASLRLGLPADEAAWARLDVALAAALQGRT